MRRLAPLSAIVLCLVAVACSGGSDSTSASPTVEEQLAFCRSIGDLGNSLHDVVAAAVPLDEAALQKALQNARADLDQLAANTRELEGGAATESFDTIVEDITAIRTTLATPDLLPVLSQLADQIGTLAADLETAYSTNNCPS